MSKELNVIIYPTGKKTFCVRYQGKYHNLEEFREGIYGVKDARKDATEILKQLETQNRTIDDIRNSEDNTNKTFNNYYQKARAIRDEANKNASDKKKYHQLMSKHILLILGSKDISKITYNDVKLAFTPLYNSKKFSTFKKCKS